MPLPSPALFVAILSCALACGCKPAGNVPAAASPAPAQPAPPAPTTTAIAYRCTDGRSLEVGFGDHDASLRWPDGRSVHLPRAESASKGGGDVYVGETVSLQRDASRIELHDGNAPPVTCSEAG